MADSRTQMKIEKWIRENWLPQKFGQKFATKSLQLSSGGFLEFDAVSSDRNIVAHFAMDQCQACPYKQACPAKPGKRDPSWHLRFTQAQANVSQRRNRSQIHLQDSRNLRAGVEATVRQVKHPFPSGKLPVRGQFRVTCLVIGSAIMGNIRRIQRFQKAKLRLEIEERERKEQIRTQKDTEQTAHDSFFPFFKFPKLSFSRI